MDLNLNTWELRGFLHAAASGEVVSLVAETAPTRQFVGRLLEAMIVEFFDAGEWYVQVNPTFSYLDHVSGGGVEIIPLEQARSEVGLQGVLVEGYLPWDSFREHYLIDRTAGE